MSVMSPKLYLLTNDENITTLTDKLERAFDTGAVSLLQIRRKHTLQVFNLSTLYQETETLLLLASRYNIPVVVNENLELASHFGIGLHLARHAGSIRVARQLLGSDVYIGRSCYGDIALFKEAKKEGASYGSMGAVFNSITKPLAKTLPMEMLKRASQVDLPLCAIGGITLENAQMIRRELAGARLDYIAITADIMMHSADTIAKRCVAWRELLENWH